MSLPKPFREYIESLLAITPDSDPEAAINGHLLLARHVDARITRGAKMVGSKSPLGAIGLVEEFACQTRMTSRDTAVALTSSGAFVCPTCALWHFDADPGVRRTTIIDECRSCVGARR